MGWGMKDEWLTDASLSSWASPELPAVALPGTQPAKQFNR